MTAATSRDSTLFLGRKNCITVTVWNPGNSLSRDRRPSDSLRIGQERVQSQLTWWGGIVNLLAINKGPVERLTFPARLHSRRILDRRRFFCRQIHPPGRMEAFTIEITVPDYAPPVLISGYWSRL